MKRNAYSIEYSLTRTLHEDGTSFPDLSIKYKKIGRLLRPDGEAAQGHKIKLPRGHKTIDFLIEPGTILDTWYEIPRQPADMFARSHYPQYYPDEDISGDFPRRVEDLREVVINEFDGSFALYVQAITREFILKRYVAKDIEQSAEFTVSNWMNRAPKKFDITMRFTKSAVDNARRGNTDFRGTFVDGTVWYPEGNRFLSLRADPDEAPENDDDDNEIEEYKIEW